MIKKLRKSVGLFRLKLAFKKLSNKIRKLPARVGVDSLLDTAFSPEFALIEPWQVRSEIAEVLRILEKKPPRAVMEIGTANGGTLFLLSRVATEDALIISLDLPGGSFGGGYPEWKKGVYESFARAGQKMHLLRANSHDETVKKTVTDIVGSSKIEFMFIDGDHTYEGVKEDFYSYQHLLAPGALIMFHDIAPHPNPIYGVDKFWKEIRQLHPANEFVESWTSSGKGLGLLTYNK
jgi:predicted O-methyltransferase YrrM